MSGLSILLLLVATSQDPKKTDTAADRARRAAVVDRIMAEPPKAAVIRLPQAEIPRVPIRMAPVQLNAQKRLTLELKEVEPTEVEENAEPLPMGRPINLADLALSKDNFDRWVFEDDLSVEQRRNRLGGLLSDKIQSAEKVWAIEADSLRKLRLAGNGDIKRYLDRVEASRVDFEAVRQDYTAGRQALVQLTPLSTVYRIGPFGPDSLFEKTLRKIRSDKQTEQLRREGAAAEPRRVEP